MVEYSFQLSELLIDHANELVQQLLRVVARCLVCVNSDSSVLALARKRDAHASLLAHCRNKVIAAGRPRSSDAVVALDKLGICEAHRDLVGHPARHPLVETERCDGDNDREEIARKWV